MSIVEVNQETCLRDSQCVEVCPMSVLTVDNEGFPMGIDNVASLCIECGHCVSVCPTSSIKLTAYPQYQSVSINPDLTISDESFIQFIRTRRSVRKYLKKSVDEADIKRLFEITPWAPSAKNGQPCHWTILNEPEKIHDLLELTLEVMETSGRFKRLIEAVRSGNDMIFRGAPCVAIVHMDKKSFTPFVDGTIAVTYLDLAAHHYGLGSCWAGFLMIAMGMAPDKYSQFLKLPENHITCGAMMLGYPDITYHQVPPRKSAPIHWL